MNNMSMSQLPSHGNASHAQSGNGREGYRPGFYNPGLAGGEYANYMCQFPQPPPKNCYCSPAAFTSLDGRTHQRLLSAYGASRPCNSNY